MSNKTAIDYDENLKLYDDLLEQLIEINNEYPKIKEMYETAKKLIEALNAEMAKHIQTIETQQKMLESQQARVEASEKKLKEQIAKADGQKAALESHLHSIENAAKRALSDIQKKENESISAVNDAQKERNSEVFDIVKKALDVALSREPDIDYDDIDSISNLQEKYGQYMKDPMIVVKSGEHPWNGDYCFAVERIEKGIAYGKVFKDGSPYNGRGKTNSKTYPADDETYSIYNGPSVEKILASLEQEKNSKGSVDEFPF